MIIISILKMGNMTIGKIQHIWQSRKVKNINKKIIKKTGELANVFKDFRGFRDNKKKMVSYKKCFNFHKFEYFKRDCPYLDKRL